MSNWFVKNWQIELFFAMQCYLALLFRIIFSQPLLLFVPISQIIFAVLVQKLIPVDLRIVVYLQLQDSRIFNQNRRKFDPKMSQENYFEKQERKRRVLDLMAANDWRGVLAQYDTEEKYREPLLVWIRPSLEMLQFVEHTLLSLGISKVDYWSNFIAKTSAVFERARLARRKAPGAFSVQYNI